MDFDTFKQHFSETNSKRLVNYVTNTVLKDSRYLFYQTKVGIQFAHCTHCNKRHNREGMTRLKHKQKEREVCPNCKSKCQVRAAGISRKYMRDKAILVWYEKSICNSEAITARVISVYRDYSEDYSNVNTSYSCCDMYLFEPSHAYYFKLSFDGWIQRKTVFSAWDNYFGGYPRFRSDANIRQAVKGTLFQYSTWEQYTTYPNHMYVTDMVEFFDLAAKYPGVEYLTKLGFNELVKAKLLRRPTYSAINWRGKTIQKMLRLNLGDIRHLRESGIAIGPLGLKLYQIAKKDRSHLTITKIYEIVQEYGHSKELQYLLKHLTLGNLNRYLTQQLDSFEEHSLESLSTVFSTYKDYIDDCERLGWDLSDRRVLFPRNLHHAHQNTISQVKLKEDRLITKMIQKRVKKLQQLYRFEQNGFFIRPAASANELIEEGKKLKHCVGTYADRYAKGKIDLLFIRKLSEPDKPFFTMEIARSKIIQCRGKNNCTMTKEVELFVKEFESNRLEKAHKKGAVAI